MTQSSAKHANAPDGDAPPAVAKRTPAPEAARDRGGLWSMLGRMGRSTEPADASAGSASRKPSSGHGSRDRDRDPHVERMRRDLKDLLGRVRGSRYVLRHLATLEYGLKKKGEAIFDDMHLPALEKAAAQLESLIEHPISPGVAALRARVGTSVQFRRRMASGVVFRPAEPPPTVAAPLYAAPPAPASPPPRKPDVPIGYGHANAMAETMPAVLMRDRISGYVADGHLEVHEVSLSHFRREATNFGILVDIPIDMPTRM